VKFSVAVSPDIRPGAPIPLQGPLAQTIPQAAALGFDGIELQIGHPSDVDHDELEELLGAHGIAVACIATGAAYAREGLCLSSTDESLRHRAVGRIVEFCDMAQPLGASVVVGMMRGRIDADPQTAAAQLAALRRSMSECVREADRRDVILIVEPINRYETNLWPTTRSVLDFLDEEGLTSPRLMLDTFHMNIEEESIAEAIRAAGDRIGLVQTVENNRLAPGCGHVDFRSIVDALADVQYDGYLSVESVPQPAHPTALQNAARLLRELAAAVAV
jgi:sugar phosphate isomerase/epimerase